MKRKVLSTTELMEHFRRKVLIIPFVECWLWIGAIAGRRGQEYGKFHEKSKGVPAHRWLYERTIGKVAEGLELDHLCRQRLCVRPSHMEPVTHTINVQRGNSPTAIAKRRRLATGVCSRGHSVAEYWNESRSACRRCIRDARYLGLRRRWSQQDLDLISGAARPSDRDLSARLNRTIIAIQTMRSIYSRNVRRTS